MGVFFPFTNRVLEVPGIFDPQPSQTPPEEVLRSVLGGLSTFSEGVWIPRAKEKLRKKNQENNEFTLNYEENKGFPGGFFLIDMDCLGDAF